MSNGRARRISNAAAAVFSLWIVYHLFVIVAMANSSSYMVRYFGKTIVPYASTLGMNTTWNFFSPDPAHTMYLKFTVYYPDVEGETPKEPLEIFMPSAKGEGVWDQGDKRQLYAMRYMVVYPQRIEGVLGPYMCKHYPGAEVVHIEHIIEPIPSLDQAAIDKRELGEMNSRFDFISRDYRCSQMNDEVTL